MNLCGKGLESLNWKWVRLKLNKMDGQLPTTLVGCLLLSPLASASTTLSCCYRDIKAFDLWHYLSLFRARPRFLVEKSKHILAIHTALYSCQKSVKGRKQKTNPFSGMRYLFLHLHVAITAWCYKQNIVSGFSARCEHLVT